MGDTKEQSTPPPLGLIPKWVRQRERFIEVCGAISRYYEAGLVIPVQWVEEYNELVEDVAKRYRKR